MLTALATIRIMACKDFFSYFLVFASFELWKEVNDVLTVTYVGLSSGV